MPGQKSREALLTRGTNQQVRIGHIAGVQATRNILDVQGICQIAHRSTLSLGVKNKFTHRIHNFLASTIANRDIHAHPRQGRGLCYNPLQGVAKLMGSKGNVTNRVHGSLLCGMQPLQKFVDNGNKPGKFIGGSLEIFGREHI